MNWKEMSIEMKENVKKYLEYSEEVYESGKNNAYTVGQLNLLFNDVMKSIQTIEDMEMIANEGDEEDSPAFLLMNHYASELDEIIEGESE